MQHILRSDATSHITLFSPECFLRHYEGQWKTAVEQELGKKIKSKKEIRLWKCKFSVQHLTVQIVLTERKTSLITVFPQFLKIMAKKAWHFRKWDNAFCLPFIVFFTQSSQYQIWKVNTYSMLTNGNSTWAASVGILN